MVIVDVVLFTNVTCYFVFPFFSSFFSDDIVAVHYALSNGANSQVIELLLTYRPNSARGFDKRGWTPLHVACGVGAGTLVIERILNCYKEAVLMRTNKGSTAKQCLNLTQATNKEEVKKMLKRAFSEVEGRYRPVQPPTSERVLV